MIRPADPDEVERFKATFPIFMKETPQRYGTWCRYVDEEGLEVIHVDGGDMGRSRPESLKRFSDGTYLVAFEDADDIRLVVRLVGFLKANESAGPSYLFSGSSLIRLPSVFPTYGPSGGLEHNWIAYGRFARRPEKPTEGEAS